MKISKTELQKIIQEELKKANLKEFFWKGRTPARERGADARQPRPARGLTPEGDRWDRHSADLSKKDDAIFTAAASYSDERDELQDRNTSSLFSILRNLRKELENLERKLGPHGEENIDDDWGGI